jgi:hypothetical protein
MLTGEWRFCRGFCKKWDAGRGFLMVRLWWIGGETWWEDALNWSAKDLPVFSGLFFWQFRCLQKDQQQISLRSSIRSGQVFGDTTKKARTTADPLWG